MKQKEVQCTFCGYTMKMDALTKGVPSVECPACGKLIMFSEDLVEAEHEHRLSLNHNAGAARPKKDCPNCGGAVDPESVICTQCGYNWLIGKTHQEQNARAEFIKWASIVIVIIAVIVVVVVVLKRDDGADGQDEAEVMTPAADVSRGDGSGMQMPEDGVLATQEQEDASELTNDPIAIPDRPGFSDDDRNRLKSYRDKMIEELNYKYPVFQKERQVKLRQGNGRIRRGEYLGIKSNILVLVEGSSTAEIPLALLDRDTRLHCDEAFRKQYIHSRLRRAAQKIQRENVTKDVAADSAESVEQRDE